MKACAKLSQWILIALIMSLLGGCLAGQVIVGSLSASRSYFSYKASKIVLYSADCAAEMLVPDAGYAERWTEAERRDLLAHVRFYQDECNQ